MWCLLPTRGSCTAACAPVSAAALCLNLPVMFPVSIPVLAIPRRCVLSSAGAEHFSQNLLQMMASSGLEAPLFNDKEELSSHMGLFLQVHATLLHRSCQPCKQTLFAATGPRCRHCICAAGC